jgi:ankyrin repeat protein
MILSLLLKFRESPIFNAIQEGDESQISEYLRTKPHYRSTDKWGVSVLTAAARAGNEKLTKKLIDLGLDINHISKNNGSNPLVSAAMSGQAGTVKILIEAGANVNVATSDVDGAFINMTPLMWAANRGYLKVAELLLKAGADLDLVNGDNTSALMYVVENPNYDLEMFKLLMHYKPSLTQKDWRGKTVLDQVSAWSKNSNRPEMLEIVENVKHA